MLGEDRPEPTFPDTRLRLRIAAVIALATAAVFVPLEAAVRPPALFSALLLPWGVHVVLDAFALVASFAVLAPRQVDRVVYGVLLGHIANAHLYLALSPTNAGLVADGLTCLLVIGVVFFSWSTRRTLLVSTLTVASFALVGLVVVPRGSGTFPLGLGALLVGAVIAVAGARVLAQLRASLAARERRLSGLSARLMSAQEEERSRLARELHDEFGQSLTAVNAYLWLIEHHGLGDLAALRERVGEARRVVARTLTAMRELSQLLRPPVLDHFGLVASLDSQLRAFGERERIVTRLSTTGVPERLPPDIETALYRITQEALTNVARHARAREVRVALTAENGGLRLEIADDGIGFPVGTNAGGTGLVGIRERARALGGTVTIGPGPGARLRIEVPFSGLV